MQSPVKEKEDEGEISIEGINLEHALIFVPGLSRSFMTKLFAVWEHKIKLLLEA